MANSSPEVSIRIAVAHDQPIFAIGLRALLDRHVGFEVVGEALTTDEAIDLVRRVAPDVVIVDHRPPRLNGVTLARMLQRAGSSARLVVLATRMSDAQIQSAIMHGAWGVVAKASACEVLPGCITQVMQGERWIGVESVHPLMRTLVQAPPTGSRSLTAREAEIVERVATGASNREIASRLRMGEQTVKNGLRRIFKKLSVANRVGLALLAINQGIGANRREPRGGVRA